MQAAEERVLSADKRWHTITLFDKLVIIPKYLMYGYTLDFAGLDLDRIDLR
jgi:hypothetical protein